MTGRAGQTSWTAGRGARLFLYPALLQLKGAWAGMSAVLGRDLLFQLMKYYEVPYVFGNPGTSELPFIEGASRYDGIEYVTALHEANAVGMAMGYARQTGKPGVVVLHVAPGLANGMGNIYNAYRAGIPLVVIAGQHHSRLLIEEPILAGDHVGQVRSMTKWAHEIRHVHEMPLALHRAFKVATTPPQGPVFLSVPYDLAMSPSPVERLQPPTRVASGFAAERAVLERIAEELLAARNPLIVSGDRVGDTRAHVEVQELAETLGIGLMAEGMSTRVNADNRHPQYLGMLPPSSAMIRNILKQHDVVLYAGVTVQAPFPLFDDRGSLVSPDTKVIHLSDDPWEIGKNVLGGIGAWGDVKASLKALLEIVKDRAGSRQEEIQRRREEVRAKAEERRRKLEAELEAERGREELTANVAAAELARHLPQDGSFAIVNEAVANAASFSNYIPMWEPNQYTAGKGGGLGHGASQAVGMALAERHRTVVAAIGDGTFLYYPQVLYSAVQVNARVLYFIVNNRAYHILKTGMQAMKNFGAPFEVVPESLDLNGPFDLVRMAESFGVPAERAVNTQQLSDALKRGLAADGPYLIDVVIQQN